MKLNGLYGYLQQQQTQAAVDNGLTSACAMNELLNSSSQVSFLALVVVVAVRLVGYLSIKDCLLSKFSCFFRLQLGN